MAVAAMASRPTQGGLHSGSNLQQMAYQFQKGFSTHINALTAVDFDDKSVLNPQHLPPLLNAWIARKLVGSTIIVDSDIKVPTAGFWKCKVLTIGKDIATIDQAISTLGNTIWVYGGPKLLKTLINSEKFDSVFRILVSGNKLSPLSQYPELELSKHYKLESEDNAPNAEVVEIFKLS